MACSNVFIVLRLPLSETTLLDLFAFPQILITRLVFFLSVSLIRPYYLFQTSMVGRPNAPVLFFLYIFLLTLFTAHANTECQQLCGTRHVPYPFGFSSGCQIRLNCSLKGTASIGPFTVQSIDANSITIEVKAKCNRSLQWSLDHMFSHKYAPTSRNAVLMQNCILSVSNCMIPATMVQTHFESSNCSSSSGNISCYSQANSTNDFMNKEDLKKSGCQYLVSSILVDEHVNGSTTPAAGVSLQMEAVDLGWWLDGDCRCSDNSDCTTIQEPVNQKAGYRCKCKDGFVGDGFYAGEGCRKASMCNPAKYLSGQCGGTTRLVVLIGGVVSGATLMIGMSLIYCFIRLRHARLNARKSSKRGICKATGFLGIPVYTYREIERATTGFSEKQRLGTGAYGTVYAGKLSYEDQIVAIKRIKQRDADSIEQVVNEIKLVSSVDHPNLVRLLGCCIEHGEQILVYEFMPNGTLCQHLQREIGHGLPWLVRLAIAEETAQAIAHLHSAIHPPIYHRDIKSSNILLDHDFRSKVADFGLCRLGMTEISHISTAPQGTPGYLDPQYHQDFHLSEKSDVYSFGVVLVEIITAMKVVDFSRRHNEVNLASLGVDRISKGRLDEIVDPYIEFHVDAWSLGSVHKVGELAFRCLAFHRDMRPSMKEVAAELEQIRSSRPNKSEENNRTVCAQVSLNSSALSDESEEEVSGSGKTTSKGGGPSASGVQNKMGMNKGSPVSVQDPWFSVSLQSSPSPSSNSLLSSAAG